MNPTPHPNPQPPRQQARLPLALLAWLGLGLLLAVPGAAAPVAAGASTCTQAVISPPVANVSHLALSPDNNRVLYTDTTNDVLYLSLERAGERSVQQLSGSYPDVTNLQFLNQGESAAVTLADGRLLLAYTGVSSPGRPLTITSALNSGPLSDLSGPSSTATGTQYLYTAIVSDASGSAVELRLGFATGDFPTSFLARLTTEADAAATFDWQQLDFTQSNTVSLIRTPLDWELWPVGRDGTTPGTIELGADTEQPAVMDTLTDDFVLVSYVNTDGDTVLEAVFVDTYNPDTDRSDFRRVLSNRIVRPGQPLLGLNGGERVLYVERNPAGGYVLVRNTPTATDRLVLAENVSPACAENPQCSLLRLVGDDVVYRGLTSDGAEAFFAVRSTAITINAEPRLLTAPTRALVFYSVGDALVFLEPLRVDSRQVVFSLNRLDTAGTVAELVPGLRWPVDRDFATDAVQFDAAGTTMVYASNPGLETETFRLFRVALVGEEGFPRRVTDTPIDITQGPRPFWLSTDAARTYALQINDDDTRSLLEVRCEG